jgi:hypothetical protein
VGKGLPVEKAQTVKIIDNSTINDNLKILQLQLLLQDHKVLQATKIMRTIDTSHKQETIRDKGNREKIPHKPTDHAKGISHLQAKESG